MLSAAPADFFMIFNLNENFLSYQHSIFYMLHYSQNPPKTAHLDTLQKKLALCNIL